MIGFESHITSVRGTILSTPSCTLRVDVARESVNPVLIWTVDIFNPSEAQLTFSIS